MTRKLLGPIVLVGVLTSGCSSIREFANDYQREKDKSELVRQQIASADLSNPVSSLTVEELSDEFETNSVLAEDKYKNKPIEVTGTINSIDDSMFSQNDVAIQVAGGGEFSLASITCSVTRTAPEVKKLRKGMRVAVRGVITSESMGIVMSRCLFYDLATNSWIGQSPRQIQKSLSREQNLSTEGPETKTTRESYSYDEAGSSVGESIPRSESGTCTFNNKSMPCTIMSTQNGMIMKWADGVSEEYVFNQDGDAIDKRGGLWVNTGSQSGFSLRHSNGNTIIFTMS